MAQSISMFNMNFGDCFVLDDSQGCMMIDFGSLSSAKSLSRPINSAIQFFSRSSGQHVWMITHPHADHYKFFQQFTPATAGAVNELYLPNVSNTGLVAVSFLALLSLSSTSPIYRFYLNLLLFTFKIKKMNPHAIIHFLDAASPCFFGTPGVCRCLWPDYTQIKADTFDALNPLIDSPELKKEAELFSQKLSSVAQSESWLGSEDEEKSSIDNLLEKLKLEKFPVMDTKQRALLSSLAHSFVLVFDSVDTKESFLFLSDCKPATFEKFSLKLHNHYCFLQISHHGTLDYLLPNLPLSDYYFFPFGPNPYGYEIAPQYYLCSLFRKKAQFVCLNGTYCKLFHTKSKKSLAITKPISAKLDF